MIACTERDLLPCCSISTASEVQILTVGRAVIAAAQRIMSQQMSEEGNLPQAMARLWRVAHFVLSDFLALSLDALPAGKTAYPPNIPAIAPSAATASLAPTVHLCQALVRV